MRIGLLLFTFYCYVTANQYKNSNSNCHVSMFNSCDLIFKLKVCKKVKICSFLNMTNMWLLRFPLGYQVFQCFVTTNYIFLHIHVISLSLMPCKTFCKIMLLNIDMR